MQPDSIEPRQRKKGIAHFLETYVKKIRKKARRGKYALRNHQITFLFINIAFFLLNVITPSSYPWFLFITGAWSVGMITHRLMHHDRRRQVIELENLPEVDKIELQTIQRIQISRRRCICSTSILGGIAGYCGLINLVTGILGHYRFPWAMISAATLAVPIFIIKMANSSITHRLIDDLADSGITFSGGKNRNIIKSVVNALPISENATQNQANKLKQQIIGQLETLKLDTPSGISSFESLLDQYIHAWESCQIRKKSLEEFLAGIDQNDIILRLDDVDEKLNSAEEQALKKELNRSKSTLESQLSTLKEIQNEKNLVDAREQAIINAMQKTYFDLLKIEHQVASTQETGMVTENEELGMFIEDLRTSWDELNKEKDFQE